ncbi:hypothetical protein LTR28_001982, partial [Elasticomyces elasticus]
FDELKGRVINIAENFTGRKAAGVSEKRAKTLLEQNKNLWKIPPNLRGTVYCYLQRQTKIELTKQLRQLAVIYQENAEKRRFGGWESEVNLLQQQKVIGLTTTGFSKFRALISALSPKVVLIEEAAETLEAPVIATCMESIEHLILVGDHQQLRPHCHAKDLENKPYYLNISLFERMVNNKVEFTTLSRQRRMIPEIRRVLYPIYQDRIEDHPSVCDPTIRPPVPGMGGINSFFFLHEWPESRDDYMSSVNFQEAHMIAAFFDYLVYNGLSIKDITILTFYNGQRKILLGLLRSNPRFSGELFNVVTADSYQGEENKVVLLSLVRSNSENKIGFLDVDNRVCVALSRAQCGFYIFGNAELLYHTSKTWRGVINIMANKHKKTEAVAKKMAKPKSRLDDQLPVTCQTHGKRTLIERRGKTALSATPELAFESGNLTLYHNQHHDPARNTSDSNRTVLWNHFAEESEAGPNSVATHQPSVVEQTAPHDAEQEKTERLDAETARALFGPDDCTIPSPLQSLVNATPASVPASTPEAPTADEPALISFDDDPEPDVSASPSRRPGTTTTTTTTTTSDTNGTGERGGWREISGPPTVTTAGGERVMGERVQERSLLD